MLIQLLSFSMEGRLSLLIVEDDLIQSMMLKMILESLNHSVLGMARFGEIAIDLVVELNPDIVFLDIGLSGTMNGIELAQKINEISNAAIIYVTGNSWAKDDERLISTNFQDILIKPIVKTDIELAISKYVVGV